MLRDYQRHLVDAGLVELRSTGRALLVAATGAGKTWVIAEVVRELHVPTLVLVPRVALVPQMHAVLPDAGILCDAYKSNQQKHVTIATVQTASRRQVAGFRAVVIDEAHMMGEAHMKLLSELNPQYILGLTATPFTASGPIYGHKKYWPPPAHAVGITELVDKGFLVPPVMAAGKHAFDVRGVKVVAGDYNQAQLGSIVTPEYMELQLADALPRLEGRKKVLWTCINITHAEQVYARLVAMGESACVYHSQQAMDEREEVLDDFKDGDARHVVAVTALSTGFDSPATDAVVLMRPTRSACLYVQTIGRALRVSPGKKNALVLDYGHCVEHLGPLDRPRVKVQLESDSRKKKVEEHAERVVSCDGCGQFYFPPKYVRQACPNCGTYPGEGSGDKQLATEADTEHALLTSAGDRQAEMYAADPLGAYRSKLSLEAMRVARADVEVKNDRGEEQFIVTFSTMDVGGGRHVCCRVFVLPDPNDYGQPARRAWAMGRARAVKTALRDWFGVPETTVPQMIKALRLMKDEAFMPEYVQADFGLKFRHGNVLKAWGRQKLVIGKHEKTDTYGGAQVGLL